MSIQSRPRRLSIAAVVLGLGALLLLGPLATPSSAAAAPSIAVAPTAAAAPTLDGTFTTLLNTLRSTLGLGTLSVDAELSGVARSWSVKMANSGTLSHNGSLTTQVQSWAKLGENVGTGGAVTQVFNALVASPPHMRNMSDREFTRIGIGTVTDAQGRLWTTHVFMRPKASVATPAAPAPAPAPAAAPATTRAPKPAPTTAAPTTAAPTTLAPATTVPAPTTVAPTMPMQAASTAAPVEAQVVETRPELASATSTPEQRFPAPLLAGAALLGLLVLGGAGFLLRHSSEGGRHK